MFKGEAAIQYRPNDNNFPETVWFKDGKQTTKKDLVDYITDKPKGGENQGTERKIEWRKLYAENIVEITLFKKRYIVVPESEEQKAAHEMAQKAGLKSDCE